MDAIILMAGGISLLTVAFVQLIKHTIKVPDRYLPAVALTVGILMGLIAFEVPELQTELSIGAHLLGGAISGLSASGLYDLSAKTIKNKDVKK